MGKNNVNDNIHEELSKIDEGLKLNKLSLNVKKSKFYMPGRNVIILNLHINSIKLECLDYFNFLCITLDKHLTWKEHIHLIVDKIYRTVGVINRLKHYLPQNVLLTICKTLITPHLNYGILTWGFNADRILKIQKKSCQVNYCKQIQCTY